MAKRKRNDFVFSNNGSIWLCRPTTKAASAHLAAHVSDEAQWLGEALAVEPRYVASLMEQLEDDGFTVGGSY